MVGDKGNEQAPAGVAGPEGPKEKSFFERNKGRIRLMAAAGILGAAAAAVSGHPKVGVGGGLEVTNPFTGESQKIGLIVSSSDEAFPKGIPESEWETNSAFEFDKLQDMKEFKVKIGSASFVVWSAVEDGRYGPNMIFRIFTAAGTEK